MVGFPHDVHGEGLEPFTSVSVTYIVGGLLLFASGIYGYVILKDGVSESDEEVIKGLRNIVRTQIGGFAVPEIIMVNGILIDWW